MSNSATTERVVAPRISKQIAVRNRGWTAIRSRIAVWARRGNGKLNDPGPFTVRQLGPRSYGTKSRSQATAGAQRVSGPSSNITTRNTPPPNPSYMITLGGLCRIQRAQRAYEGADNPAEPAECAHAPRRRSWTLFYPDDYDLIQRQRCTDCYQCRRVVQVYYRPTPDVHLEFLVPGMRAIAAPLPVFSSHRLPCARICSKSTHPCGGTSTVASTSVIAWLDSCFPGST